MTEGRARGRLGRWARRLGIALVVVFVVTTLSATGYDLATSGDQKPAAQLYPGPFVRVGKTLVAYRSWGAKGSPIVLLGGAAEPSWVWHEVGPKLAAAGHRVFALDLPPFGYTERRGPYTMAGWTSLVHGFTQRMGLRRPLLVGHSLGAGVAASYALARPSAVRGIVLLDGDALPAGHGIGWLSHLLVFPWYTAGLRLATSSDWFVSRLVRNAWGPDPPNVDQSVVEEFERPFRVDGTADALRELADHGGPGVSRAQLRGLRVPRAVVWGEHDHVDEISEGRATAAALGVPLVTIPGAGHLSMLTQPRDVAAAILHAPTR